MTERCPETRIVAGRLFVCIKAPHADEDEEPVHPSAWGNRTVQTKASDRHWFVAEDRAPKQ